MYSVSETQNIEYLHVLLISESKLVSTCFVVTSGISTYAQIVCVRPAGSCVCVVNVFCSGRNVTNNMWQTAQFLDVGVNILEMKPMRGNTESHFFTSEIKTFFAPLLQQKTNSEARAMKKTQCMSWGSLSVRWSEEKHAELVSESAC